MKIFDNLCHRLLGAHLMAGNDNLCILRRLVRCADTGEVGNLASASLLVQTLRVALLGLLDRDVDEHLDEGQRPIFPGGSGMEITSDFAVGLVGADEGGNGNGGGVCEKLCDLRELSALAVCSCDIEIFTPLIYA